ncbi:MFS transporter [Miltoncostaea marina]|uniref:MFS transporter n=1 Tax=Miltoncostaea marina TaxID=2843215 RepID=UPI0031BAFCA1
MLGGSLVTSAGLVAIAAGAGTGYLVLASAALVAYVGLNAVTTAHRALIPETYVEEDRAAATGAEELAMLAGTTVGVAAGGLLVEWRTWAPFAAAALAVPLLAAPTVRRMRGRERPGDPIGAAEARAPLRYYARLVARHDGVRRVLAAQALWVLGYAALPSFFVLYADHVLGLGPAPAGGLLVAFGLLTGAAMLLAGLERRAERHLPLLALGVVLMGGGLLAMTPADRVVEAAPGLVAAAVGFGLLSTLGFPVMSRFIPPGEAGAYTAAYFSARAVAGAVALPAAGGAIAATGSYRALVACGGVATLSALVPLAPMLAGHRLRRPRRPARTPARRLAGLAAVAAACLGAGLLVAGTPLRRADHALFRLLNDLGPGPALVDDILVGPDFRNYVLLTVVATAAAVAWRRDRALRLAATLAATGVATWLVVRLMWLTWDRPRPQLTLDGVEVGAHDWSGYASFPSGHVAVWLAMSIAVWTVFPRARAPLLVLVAAVAVTRVVGGAHFPSDVLSAVAVGWAAARAVEALALSAASAIRAESRSGRNELTSSP